MSRYARAAAIAAMVMATTAAAAFAAERHQISAADIYPPGQVLSLSAGPATIELTRDGTFTGLANFRIEAKTIDADRPECEFIHEIDLNTAAAWPGYALTASHEIEIPCDGDYRITSRNKKRTKISAIVTQTLSQPTTTTTEPPPPEPDPEPKPELDGFWTPAQPGENPGTAETAPRFFGEEPTTPGQVWIFTGNRPEKIELGDLEGEWTVRNFQNARITIRGETGICGKRARTADRITIRADGCEGTITIRVAPTPRRTAWKIKVRPKS